MGLITKTNMKKVIIEDIKQGDTGQLSRNKLNNNFGRLNGVISELDSEVSEIHSVNNKLTDIVNNLSNTLVSELKLQHSVENYNDLFHSFPNVEDGWASLVKNDPNPIDYPNGQIYVWRDLNLDWLPTGLTGFPKDIVTKSSLTQTLGTASDKAPSEKAVAESFRSSDFLASESANGLMSAEQVKNLNEIIEYMKPIEERYNSCAFIQFKNEGPFWCPDAITFESATDTAYIETDGFLVKIKVAVGWNSWHIQVLNPNGYIKLYWNGGGGFRSAGNLYSIVDKIQVASSTLKYMWLDVGQYLIADTSAAPSLLEFQTWNNNRLVSLDLTKNLLLYNLAAAGSQSLTHVWLDGSSMLSGNFLDSTKLTDLTFVAEALNELIELNIAHTAITKAVLLAIEAKWTSRVGKSAGVLTLNEALFNELSTAERSLFINKNITFNI